MVSETLRLPLRAVVASSSAMRSSRSVQQLPPRSAACAEPANRPTAARTARRLVVFISPPIIFILQTVNVEVREAARAARRFFVSGPSGTHARERTRLRPDADSTLYRTDAGTCVRVVEGCAGLASRSA